MHRVATLLACAALAHAVACSAQAPAFDDALSQYEAGRYDLAFAAFAELADDGHCEAARIARGMMRFGTELYARTFDLPPARTERWPRMPGCVAPSVATRE